MWWNKKRASEQSVRGSLPTLNKGLEIGTVDNAILYKLFAELDSKPEVLLPAEDRTLQVTAFLLWKCDRGPFAKRLLFTSLAWFLKNTTDREAIKSLTENIRHILKAEGVSPSDEDIEQTALSGRFDQVTSWRLDADALGRGKPVFEISGGKVTTGRVRFEKGFTPLVSGKLPVTTFRGWLKRHDPASLNDVGRLIMATIFPMFGEPTPQQFIARSERLLDLGVSLAQDDRTELSLLKRVLEEGVNTRLRRHRRYSGGDGLLPRGCYASVCKDGIGDDGGTLSRELLAYVDQRVPGLVYVCDSTNPQMSQRLGIGVRPGFCAVYILLFPPSDEKLRAVFEAVYSELFAQVGHAGEGAQAFVIETEVDHREIENVIDLRLPSTRQWFFDQFGNGDGHFLVKDGGGARDFHDLVPTLMHPALGGSDVTHAIGSWMRSSGVNALIFPSARSDPSVSVVSAQVVDWRGWNLVDYRTATVAATETTESAPGWPDFLQPGVQLSTIEAGDWAGSWKTTGVQSLYDRIREQIEGSA